jgi:hypothetical protein
MYYPICRREQLKASEDLISPGLFTYPKLEVVGKKGLVPIHCGERERRSEHQDNALDANRTYLQLSSSSAVFKRLGPLLAVTSTSLCVFFSAHFGVAFAEWPPKSCYLGCLGVDW